jgi:hypothetical protein
VVPSNPLEAEKMELQKEIEKAKESMIKYDDKLNKIKDNKERFKVLMEKYNNGVLVIELLDKTGERKYVKTKLNDYATSFLSDKTSYILAFLTPGQTRIK